MQQVALRRDHLVAEVEEAARHLRIPGIGEGVGDQRAVARPHVGVGVAGVARDVEVVGGDDRPAVVDLAAQDEEAAPVDIGHDGGEIAEALVLLGHPEGPVVPRALQERRRPLLPEGAVDPGDLFKVGPHGDPVPAGGLAARRHAQVQSDRGVHAALRHRVAGEDAVLGVAPGPLPPLKLLDPHGPLVHAQVPPVGGGPRGVDHEPALPFVVEDRAPLRLVVGGVAHLRPADVEVLAEEAPDLPFPIPFIGNDQAAQVEVLVEVHGVAARQAHAEFRVVETHLRDERVGCVVEGALPARMIDPAKLPVHPDAEAEGMARRMVLLSDVRPVEVAERIGLVEVHQERAVTDRDVAGHQAATPSRRATTL